MTEVPTKPKAASCPICGKLVDQTYRPFCSRRCADIDLAKWFTGSYAIAGRVEDEGDGDAASGTPDTADDEPEKH